MMLLTATTRTALPHLQDLQEARVVAATALPFRHPRFHDVPGECDERSHWPLMEAHRQRLLARIRPDGQTDEAKEGT
eukprot:8724141-Pyramimonas_sp.AAC.1